MMLVSAFVLALAAPSRPPAIGLNTADETRLIAIARNAVVAEVTHKPQAHLSGGTPPRPVFVTIESNGQVLGCRGDLLIRTTSLEQEVQKAARAAAAHDPRYKPLTPSALKNFKVTVTLVQSLEPISNVDSLTPDQGLVLKSGSHTGVVLPWEGKDPAIRLGWAYKKAGVASTAPASLFRLVAERFRG